MILLFLTPFQRMVEGLIKPDYSSKRRILLLLAKSYTNGFKFKQEAFMGTFGRNYTWDYTRPD